MRKGFFIPQVAPALSVWPAVFVLHLAAFGALIASHTAVQGQECRQPEPVCAARAAVFAISAFDPIGSAVRIGDDRLVTTRHTVADRTDVELFLSDGTRISAKVVPTDYKGDVVLLTAPDLPPGPLLEPGPAAGLEDADLYTVGADTGFRRIRAYDPGRITLLPATQKPLARLHHNAYSQPGNSGGALVNAEGALVGIVASGGESRHEAVPAAAIAVVSRRSGPAYAEASAEIGAAVRICTLKLEELRNQRGPLAEQDAKALDTSCRRTGNRQYYDLAAQTFGVRGRTDAAIALFQASLEQDPHSLNGRLGLAITYHLAGRYEEELPHLRFLMEHAPEDLQVLRLAIQAGTWGGDSDLAQRAFETVKRVNPNAAPAAERFMSSPPPRPQPRQ